MSISWSFSELFQNNVIRQNENSPPHWVLMFTMDSSLLNLLRKQLIICESLRKMNNIFSELSKLASLKYNSETSSSFVTKKYFRLHSIGARSISREIPGSFDDVFEIYEFLPKIKNQLQEEATTPSKYNRCISIHQKHWEKTRTCWVYKNP